VFPLIQAQMESRTFAPMQDKGHPKMTETTVNFRMPPDIFLKAETKHRHRCRPAVTADWENCKVMPENANDLCSE
jgi:hypothetical protein